MKYLSYFCPWRLIRYPYDTRSQIHLIWGGGGRGGGLSDSNLSTPFWAVWFIDRQNYIYILGLIINYF
jgi:hypothetical protein